ncbi:MAG: Ig-like domain-containing protein [Pseudomonadota bacterium]
MPDFGTDGDDTLNGDAFGNFLYGFSGDDSIHGNGGNDVIFAGAGDDTVKGGTGRDFILAGAGDDIVSGGNGRDHIRGKRGDDLLDGGSGDDTLKGSRGEDTLLGGVGNDALMGGRGNDELTGGVGNDTLKGGRGDDTLTGGEGNDTLKGGSGHDVATYDGSILDYVFSTKRKKITVTDANASDGDDGTDKLIRIEELQFNDFTLMLDGSNNGPLLVAEDPMTDEGVATDFSVDAFDFDGDPLTLDNVSVTGTGLLTLISTSPQAAPLGTALSFDFSFDPGSGYDFLVLGESVTETVTLQVSDGNGGVATSTFEIVIEGTNTAPVAVDDGPVTVDEDTSVTINVLDNDFDDDGDPITITDASADNGTVTINADGTLTYVPDADYNGTDMITYTIADGVGGTDQAIVPITVNPVNDAPVTAAADDPVEQRDESDGRASVDLSGRTSDADIGDVLTITAAQFVDAQTGAPLGIALSLVNGTASFDPADLGLDAGESLPVQIEYFVQDDSGAANDTTRGVVDVTILGDGAAPDPNTSPVAGVLDLTGDPNFNEADGDITVDLSGVISDPDGDTLTVVALLTSGGQEITFSQSGNTLTFDPGQFLLDLGETDLIELSYIIDDASGAANSQATGSILFNLDGAEDAPPPPPTNNAPIAAPVTGTFDEVDGEIVIDLNTSVSDPDAGDVLTINQVLFGGTEAVEFTLENGVLIIDPASFGLGDGETEPFGFTYAVDDGTGAANGDADGTIAITVNGFTEEPPVDPPTTAVLDFEPFSDDVSASIDITGTPYEGFSFTGIATVVETDEIGGGRDPNGVVLGQTTDGGGNVVVGTASTNEIVTPVLDENGDPVLDEGGAPLFDTEIVIDEAFGILAPGMTLDLDDPGIALSFGDAGQDLPLPDPLPDPGLRGDYGDAFSLDGMSLNVVSGDGVTVSVTVFTLGVIEVPTDFNPAFSNYFVDYIVADRFEFVVDASTPADVIDLNAALAGVNGSDETAFDDIYAVTFETDTGTGVVLDDLLVTL